ncbi:hypothetical protein DL765_008125 [Monosporascus sp. GIB2]|nr:hypothetical protein DL765_008125 [Monosporascus sp. GIB2]
MAEVLRATSFTQGVVGPVDEMNMSNSFGDLSLATIQEQRESRNRVDRLPRRAFSCTDQAPANPAFIALQAQRRISPPETPRESTELNSHAESQQRVDLAPVLRILQHPTNSFLASRLTPRQTPNPPKRPAIPTPQRSYSVMEVEPVPITHHPGVALTLSDIPAELHYTIFDFLDPIDSACLGLTCMRFYSIHRQLHGKVSLGARREGPNDMEWVWRHAGPFVASTSSGSGKHNALAVLSPRGQVYCRKCRTARCELHKHIKEWFAEGQEYCEVSQKFGRPAEDGAKPVCYRSSPRHPHRCGRHTRQQRAVRLA